MIRRSIHNTILGALVLCLAASMLFAQAVSDQPALTMDLTASLTHAAGVKPPRPFDGMDILSLVRKTRAIQSRTLFWRARRGDVTHRAVRAANLKYYARQTGARAEEYLFDLGNDAAEKSNLLTQHPMEVERLKRLLAEWERAVKHTR